jgi:hypothetical protein
MTGKEQVATKMTIKLWNDFCLLAQNMLVNSGQRRCETVYWPLWRRGRWHQRQMSTRSS